MSNYFLPIDLNVYNTLDPNYGEPGPWTYSSHNGDGKLDMAYNQYGKDIYSMTNGTVVFNGIYNDGIITAIEITTNDTILNETIKIRYMHGNFLSNLTSGTSVTQGQKIGTVAGHDANGLVHLHIDIQDSNGSFLYGTFENNNTIWRHYRTNKQYKIKNNINIAKINEWNSQHGTHYGIGYNWLIFAQAPQYLTKNTSDTISVSSQNISAVQNSLISMGQGTYTLKQCEGLIKLYNALINTGLVNNGAAAAIAGNALAENLDNCITDGPSKANWGIHYADGGYDCSFWSFHQNPSAYENFVRPYLSDYLISKGLDWTKGDYNVQAQAMVGIAIPNEATAARNQKWGVSNTRNSIISPKYSSKTICATYSLQSQYVNNFNKFFEDGGDIGEGALLFEGLFEKSGNNGNLLARRAAAAYALDDVKNNSIKTITSI